MGKQTEILQALYGKESATKKEIYAAVSFRYYCNWEKHLGDVLSRMVKNGSIERVKKGVYRLRKKVNAPGYTDPNQLSMF